MVGYVACMGTMDRFLGFSRTRMRMRMIGGFVESALFANHAMNLYDCPR